MWPATCMRPYGSTCMRVSPAQFDTVPGAPRDGRPVTAQLATAAAAVTRFEAETAPHIAAEAPTPASLEDLRLQTPALRPVGCWWLGYARAASGRMSACSTAPVNARKALLHGVSCTRRCQDLSGVTEAGLRLQQCSGCNTARYCSEACQKAAWRAGHKGACRRLQARA